jgi:diguanylate cyclase (GGDEF)-like protein
MAGRIAFALCEHYLQEAQAALEAEKMDDAVLVTFPARCGRPPLTGEELSALVESRGDVEQVDVFGACCLKDIGDFTSDSYSIRIHKSEQCFHLVADPVLIEHYLNKGAYLTTPGWVANWEVNVTRLGLNQNAAREMFAETTTSIVLLDTGIDEQSTLHLQTFARYVDRPFEVFYTGLSVMRLLLTRTYLAWQIKVHQIKAAVEIQEIRQQSATHAMAMDLLSNLALIVNETDAVEGMLDIYRLLFAPRRIYYLNYVEGLPDRLWIRPEETIDDAEEETIKKRMAAFSEESGYTESGRGFFLRIVRRGEVRGVIVVEDIAFPDYLDHYFNLALSIVNICALPIENARKYEKLLRTEEMLKKANEGLYHLSTTDALTGIANRRAYDEYIELEWRRMLRNNTPLSLIICDIDFFKKYNDHYGHKAGDHCLHTVAQSIRQIATRPDDFVARYGGEEFAVVLPQTKETGALHVAEKIRMAVFQHHIPHEDSTASPNVTLSLGIATIQPPLATGLSTTSLFRAADNALYEAKRQGRNRTVLHKIETQEGLS